MATIKLSGELGPAKRLQYNPRPALAPSLLNKPYIMFPEISTNILARILLACLVNCRQLSSVGCSCELCTRHYHSPLVRRLVDIISVQLPLQSKANNMLPTCYHDKSIVQHSTLNVFFSSSVPHPLNFLSLRLGQ